MVSGGGVYCALSQVWLLTGSVCCGADWMTGPVELL